MTATIYTRNGNEITSGLAPCTVSDEAVRAARRIAAWTDAETATLRAAYADGLTDAEIARLLQGRTETAIRRRRQALGLVARSWTVDRERLRELHDAGVSTSAMAKALGCTPQTVQQLRHELGLRRPSGRPRRASG